MNVAKGTLFGAAVIILAVTLASGPILGLSLLSGTSQLGFEPSSGSLEARAISIPDTASVDGARFQADVAHLNVSPVMLNVSNVSGQPTISYKLRIGELGYATSTVSFLDASVSGRYPLEFREQTVDPDRFDNDEYETRLIVVVRDDAGERVVVDKNVTTVVET